MLVCQQEQYKNSLITEPNSAVNSEHESRICIWVSNPGHEFSFEQMWARLFSDIWQISISLLLPKNKLRLYKLSRFEVGLAVSFTSFLLRINKHSKTWKCFLAKLFRRKRSSSNRRVYIFKQIEVAVFKILVKTSVTQCPKDLKRNCIYCNSTTKLYTLRMKPSRIA